MEWVKWALKPIFIHVTVGPAGPKWHTHMTPEDVPGYSHADLDEDDQEQEDGELEE